MDMYIMNSLCIDDKLNFYFVFEVKISILAQNVVNLLIFQKVFNPIVTRPVNPSKRLF